MDRKTKLDGICHTLFISTQCYKCFMNEGL